MLMISSKKSKVSRNRKIWLWEIQKYALASSANAAAVGDSPGSARDAPSGTSSTTHGYIAGGQASATNAIEKFSLSSDGNSAAIANLVYGTESGAAGTEY